MSVEARSEIIKASVVEASLSPAPIPAEDVVSGSPEASVAVIWANEERTLGVGVWHCTPGTFYGTAPDETVVLIEGRATLTPDGGAPIELSAGDVGFIPGGRVLWDVHETVRKGFHIYDPSGEALPAD